MNNRIASYNRGRYIYRPVENTRVVLNPVPDTPEPAKQLLDLIYSRDPVTGLPSGDLAMFLNEKANPEVKAFIESSLLKNNENLGDGLSIPQDMLNAARKVIGDDDIAFFSKATSESSTDYASRMNKFFDSQRAIAAEEKRIAQLKKIMLASKES